MKKILISEYEIQRRIEELANQIDSYLEKEDSDDYPVFVCVLTGSVFFFSELVRKLKTEVITEYIKVSSYQGKVSTQNVQILKDISVDISNRIVFVIEDIIDTGLTVSKITSLFKERDPAKILVCTLLDKPSKRLVDVKVDFCGFVIPPEFVVGYGLDLDEKYRNKPYIYVFEGE
ncbi:MAG: hypoxanthine phosphoribosyltransferase [Candidatus Calescibacterium sp.]|nr:hypoxanthine phosphoribosyltransferase [Candidatus Calescibacterium sp.]MCX7972577.1 hypoxanthine phosphoribosyltransferase [bacterium]MDW8195788.1 hypoxanthine phosphoribosyltransferase [Candidatus Calescibacterium sp.]